MNSYNDLLKKDRNIIIFGAGIIGRFTLSICKEKGIDVVAFCDNVLGNSNGFIDDVPIFTLAHIKKTHKNMTFIIASSAIDSMVVQLEENKIDNWIPIIVLFKEKEILKLKFPDNVRVEAAWYTQKYFINKERLFLNSVDVMVTEKCSLRCKECANLMQYYKDPQNFSFEEIRQSLKRLFDMCEEIYEVRLLGGEPFMAPNMKDIIHYLNQCTKVKRICIYTNATILPQNDLLEEIQEGKKTWFSISNYDDLSYKLREMIKRLSIYQIPFEVKNIDYWTRCSSFNKHNRSEKNLKKVYMECCARHITTLLKGKLYPCPFIANGINLHSLPLNDNNYVDIMRGGINEVKNEINGKLLNPSYFSLCDYCNGRPYLNLSNSDKIKPHEQISQPLGYQMKY